jgi:hypothetical protein
MLGTQPSGTLPEDEPATSPGLAERTPPVLPHPLHVGKQDGVEGAVRGQNGIATVDQTPRQEVCTLTVCPCSPNYCSACWAGVLGRCAE